MEEARNQCYHLWPHKMGKLCPMRAQKSHKSLKLATLQINLFFPWNYIFFICFINSSKLCSSGSFVFSRTGAESASRVTRLSYASLTPLATSLPSSTSSATSSSTRLMPHSLSSWMISSTGSSIVTEIRNLFWRKNS